MNTLTSFPRRRIPPALKAEVLQACGRPDACIPDIAQKYGLTTDLIRRWLRGHGVRQVASQTQTPQGFLPVRVAPPSPPPAALHIEVYRGGTLIKIDCPATCATDCTDWLKAALQ